MAIPKKDSDLVAFCGNMNTRINATPAAYGLNAADGLTFSSKYDPYLASYTALAEARADGTRSESMTETKDATKAALLAYAREIYTTVQANTLVLDSNKILLGVTVRKIHPTPAPVPDVVPGVDFVSVVGRTVTVRVHDADVPKRSKPPGVKGAVLFTYVGATPPSDISQWVWRGASGRDIIETTFDDSVAPGSLVWYTACWINSRNDNGSACTPVSTHLQYGGLSMAA